MSKKKTATEEATQKRVVLVGTYKGEQLTKWRGWYNYPISEKDKIGADDAAKITVVASGRAGFPGLVRRPSDSVKDDHVPFLKKGYKAIDLIDFSYGPDNSYWHTPNDTIDKVSVESLFKSGRVVVEMLNILL